MSERSGLCGDYGKDPVVNPDDVEGGSSAKKTSRCCDGNGGSTTSHFGVVSVTIVAEDRRFMGEWGPVIDVIEDDVVIPDAPDVAT